VLRTVVLRSLDRQTSVLVQNFLNALKLLGGNDAILIISTPFSTTVLNYVNTIMYVYVIYISVQNFTFTFEAFAEKTAKNSSGGTFYVTFCSVVLVIDFTFSYSYHSLHMPTFGDYELQTVSMLLLLRSGKRGRGKKSISG